MTYYMGRKPVVPRRYHTRRLFQQTGKTIQNRWNGIGQRLGSPLSRSTVELSLFGFVGLCAILLSIQNLCLFVSLIEEAVLNAATMFRYNRPGISNSGSGRL